MAEDAPLSLTDGADALKPSAPSVNPLLMDVTCLSDGDLLHLIFGHRSLRLNEQLTIVLEDIGLLGLAGLDPKALMTIVGFSPAMACRFGGLMDFARRLATSKRPPRPSLHTPEEVCSLMGPLLTPLSHEQFWCLPLDPRKRLIGRPRLVSRGDIDGTDAGPRAFTRETLLAHAASVIAVHNHPSGDPTPSQNDRAVTARLVNACRIIDVPLLDHVIIGDGGRFVSIRRDAPDLFR